MSIPGKIGQYQISQQSPGQSPKAVKAVGKIASSIQELKTGQVFEGTVKNLKNGQATLVLSNGQTVKAQVDGKVPLKEGQSMFFQVKSTQDNQIAIRPFSANGQLLNPTLYKALDAANLPVSQQYLDMVDQMMQEGMSVDKQSLAKMAQVLISNQGADISTLVQMTKLGLKIDAASIEQFNNYKNNEQALLHTMNEVADGIGETIGMKESGQEMLSLHLALTGIFSASREAAAETLLLGQSGTAMQGMPGAENFTMPGAAQAVMDALEAQAGAIPEMVPGAAGEAAAELTQTPGAAGEAAAELTQTPGAAGEAAAELTQTPGAAGEAAAELTQTPGTAGEAAAELTQTQTAGQPAMTSTTNLASVLGKEGLDALAKQLISLQGDSLKTAPEPLFVTQTVETPDGTFTNVALNAKLGASEFMQELSNYIAKLGGGDGEKMQSLFSGKEYQSVLKEALLEQWTMTPESLKEKATVDQFYNRLQSQMSKIQQMFAGEQSAGAQAAAKGAANTLNNLEMMNQINQIYNYVQLPIKLMDQHANGELYVYTNKKNLRQKDGELSALLHLELENLGTTDIMVKMKGLYVSADFSLDNDLSFELVHNNLDALKRRLELAGYDVRLSAKKAVEKHDFVKDFLEKGERVESISRYSFDVRA